MRKLVGQEREDFFNETHWTEEDTIEYNGDVFEATVQELVNDNITLCAGESHMFKILNRQFYNMKIRALIFLENGDKKIGGCFCIEAETEAAAELIQDLNVACFHDPCYGTTLKGFFLFEDD